MISIKNQQEIWALPTGTVVGIKHGWYDHVALIGDRLINGERSVLAFSAQAGGFVEQTYSAFAGESNVTINGYLGSLPPETVMQRARLKHGQAYSWINFNCEHFVRYAHGVPIESPQLRQWAFLGGVLGVFALASTRT